jgi:hypothetical protein
MRSECCHWQNFLPLLRQWYQCLPIITNAKHICRQPRALLALVTFLWRNQSGENWIKTEVNRFTWQNFKLQICLYVHHLRTISHMTLQTCLWTERNEFGNTNGIWLLRTLTISSDDLFRNCKKKCISLTNGFFSTLLSFYVQNSFEYSKDVENKTSAQENNI